MNERIKNALHLIAVAVLVGLSTFFLAQWFMSADLLPAAASAQAGSYTEPYTIDWLFGLHWKFIAFFFSLIIVFMLYSVVFFRQRAGKEEYGAYIADNSRLEVLWTLVPLGIVIGFAVIGAQTLAKVERRAPDALVVNVIASQWSWRFEYTDPATPGAVVVTGDLGLPVDRQVLLRLHSEDVIHSFWVPEFRVKQDVLPGGEEYIRELRITPNQIAEFKVRCAELCGVQHYAMMADVSVMSGADFATWLTEQSGVCDLTAAECGQRWATGVGGCTACHSLDGSALVGPSWLGLFGSTVTLADGTTVIADEAYLLESILTPNAKIHEGFNPNIMPPTLAERLTPEQIQQIIAFIMTLGRE